MSLKINPELLPTAISKKEIDEIISKVILENNLTENSKIVEATIEALLEILKTAKVLKIED